MIEVRQTGWIVIVTQPGNSYALANNGQGVGVVVFDDRNAALDLAEEMKLQGYRRVRVVPVNVAVQEVKRSKAK